MNANFEVESRESNVESQRHLTPALSPLLADSQRGEGEAPIERSMVESRNFVPLPAVTCFEGLAFCAWCGGFVGPVFGATDAEDRAAIVSHSICRGCKTKVWRAA